MALSWALAVLSLLPLLEAQSPECANLTAAPITNATLDQLSGKWFYIASAFRNPEFNESSRTIQAAFFYFDINYTEDKILLREYLTIGNQCVYNSSYLNVQRENGSLSKHEFGKEQVGYLLLTKDPTTFMLAFSPKDEQNMGLSFYTDKPQATQEQMREFHEAIMCMGMQKSEIMYSDEKQDVCGPLEKEHQEEKPKENEGS
ncbi:alpha-1-acid glycoprotein-like [Herpailurus yagouaroundi]|uniref:alpha-1-acid glycoprotein-like n=1 Tax=Herpailurus yagouaroundi TaxID=1608482 RepID=UPI001AD65A4A|nr:alpha-1-acid glycoprotein-like [Puma yagouaroundi]